MAIDRVLRRSEVEKIIGMTRSGIYALLKKGDFPTGIRLSSRARGWRESEITAWLESRAKADPSQISVGRSRGRPRKTYDPPEAVSLRPSRQIKL